MAAQDAAGTRSRARCAEPRAAARRRFAGAYEHVFETTTAGVTIQAPQLDINTVAAGGGSCLQAEPALAARPAAARRSR